MGTDRRDELDDYDLSQIPEYFVTETGRIEPAGGNCVRIYKCVRHGTRLVPVFAVVTPVETLVSGKVRERALEIFNETQMRLRPLLS